MIAKALDMPEDSTLFVTACAKEQTYKASWGSGYKARQSHPVEVWWKSKQALHKPMAPRPRKPFPDDLDETGEWHNEETGHNYGNPAEHDAWDGSHYDLPRIEYCPHCAGTPEIVWNYQHNGSQVKCDNCGMAGPTKQTKRRCITAWNDLQ